MGVGGEDENVRELLVTRSKASVIKLPFPSLALPSGISPASTSPPTPLLPSTLLFPPPPTTSTSSSSSSPPPRPPFFPVACALSTSGNLVLIALPRHFCVYSMLSRSLEVPLIPLSSLPLPSPPTTSLAGCHFLPSFLLSSVLTLRILLYTTDGDSILLSLSTTPTDEGGKGWKKILIHPLATFLPPPSHPSHRPSTLTLDGDRLVAGTPAGEVFEWVIPPHLLTPLTSSTFTSPFTDALTFHSTPSFPSSPITFPVAMRAGEELTLEPAHISSISPPPSLPQPPAACSSPPPLSTPAPPLCC